MLIIGCDYHPGFQQIAELALENRVEERFGVLPNFFRLGPCSNSAIELLRLFVCGTSASQSPGEFLGG